MGFMQFECALFILVVVGMACAVVAALSALFWPRDLEPQEKLVISNWKRLKKAKTTRYRLQS
jgi:ABC-type protease/lipase transport system fused ATPase/permease subunit